MIPSQKSQKVLIVIKPIVIDALVNDSKVHMYSMKFSYLLFHDVSEDEDVELRVTGSDREGGHVGLAQDAQTLSQAKYYVDYSLCHSSNM